MPRTTRPRILSVRENPMVRTTISVHETILQRAKDVCRREHSTLGSTLSELLSLGLKVKEGQTPVQDAAAFRLKEFSMGRPLVALEDKVAVSERTEKGYQ